MKNLTKIMNIIINVALILAALWTLFCVFYLCFPGAVKYAVARVIVPYAYGEQFLGLMAGVSYGSIAATLMAVFARYAQMRAITAKAQTAAIYNKAMSELAAAQELSAKHESAAAERENRIAEQNAASNALLKDIAVGVSAIGEAVKKLYSKDNRDKTSSATLNAALKTLQEKLADGVKPKANKKE
jgi:hypothetical protein